MKVPTYRAGVRIVIATYGSSIPAMSFGAGNADGLSTTDTAAGISYTKNNWSNKTGQLVQPAEVLAQRGK